MKFIEVEVVGFRELGHHEPPEKRWWGISPGNWVNEGTEIYVEGLLLLPFADIVGLQSRTCYDKSCGVLQIDSPEGSKSYNISQKSYEILRGRLLELP